MITALLPMLLVLLATFVFAGIAAGSNAYLIKLGYNVSHLWEGRQRAAALGGFAVLAYHQQWQRPYLMLLAFASACCLFGLRFDIRLNLRRLLNRYYLGTDPQTATSDKAVGKYGLSGRAYAFLKLAGVIVFAGAAVLLSGCATLRATSQLADTDVPQLDTARTFVSINVQKDSANVTGKPAPKTAAGRIVAKVLGGNTGKTKYKNATIQNTFITGNGNQVAASGQKAPATAGTGNTVAEKYKPVEKVRTITKTITKTASTPIWVFGLLFGLGFAARQFGPLLLKAVLPV